MTNEFLQIAIDGPSGTGKSSVAKAIASNLGFGYLDTGALYRCVALAAAAAKIQPDDLTALKIFLSKISIEISTDPKDQWIQLDGVNVAEQIRTLEISDLSSKYSAVPVVREYLLTKQREMISNFQYLGAGIVVEGRDIGSVVLPDADLKFFLTAEPNVRAKRRGTELGISNFEITKHLQDRDARDEQRPLSPLKATKDAIVVDTSTMNLADSIDLLMSEISQSSAFTSELKDDEVEIGSLQFLDEWLPVVAILGRPNVGKSTLVNRIIGQRSAVTEDTPGVTRDRVSYQAEWNGRNFIVVDTGGWDSKATGLYEQVARQAEFAITQADLCLLVIDATVGATDDDLLLIRKLRESKIPILLIANKVDSPKDESDASSLWNLGLGEPFLVSALHGRNAGDLLDLIVKNLPTEPQRFKTHFGSNAVAILGRPNVGKSSLLNHLTGQSRAVVSDIAGTTVDPIDEHVRIGDTDWIFIDTAGIRKKFKQDSGHEYYAVLRTQGAIDRADVVVVLIDATEELSDQDRRIINLADEAGKGILICFNKWDLVDEDRRISLDREIDRDLQQQRWIPRINISATSGRSVLKIAPALEMILANWRRRIPTSELNKLIKEFVMENPHPLRGGRQAKILFATQVATSPPTFALFATRQLDDGYVRFLERRIRENFEFAGTPLRFKQRIRNEK